MTIESPLIELRPLCRAPRPLSSSDGMARLPGLLLLAFLACWAAHNPAAGSREADAVRQAHTGQPAGGVAAAAAAAQPTLHTLIATECSQYFTWQVPHCQDICMPSLGLPAS